MANSTTKTLVHNNGAGKRSLPSHATIELTFKNLQNSVNNSALFAALSAQLLRPLPLRTVQHFPSQPKMRQSLPPSTVRTFSDTYVKFNTESSVLMVKQEDMWGPSIRPTSTATLSTIYGISRFITRHLGHVCEHLSWEQEFGFLVPKMEDFAVGGIGKAKTGVYSFDLPVEVLLGDVEELLDAPSKVNRQLEYALFHEIGCQCRDSIHWGAVYVHWIPSKSQSLTLYRKSCPQCYTDYAFSVIHMPGCDTELFGNDRSFVFTTWKHVSGAGEEDVYWKLHTDEGTSTLRCEGPGWCCDRYELYGDSQTDPGECRHIPQVPSRYTYRCDTSNSPSLQKYLKKTRQKEADRCYGAESWTGSFGVR